MTPLTISLVQSDLSWENKENNLRHFTNIIAALPAASQVVILPEMFSTGFSMKPEQLAESMEGETVNWMRSTSRQYRKILTGSLIIVEDGRYYNRLIWMQPDGRYYYYDKRHLFAFAGEDRHYTAGDKRLIVQVNGWKICLQVCYDLRFPVWARQKTQQEEKDSWYDMLIYVANWPERRSHAWKTLLMARAIENQCFVAGVNRVGADGNGVAHSGDSALIDPMGYVLWQPSNQEAVHTYTLMPDELKKVREQLPFLRDADSFMLL